MSRGCVLTDADAGLPAARPVCRNQTFLIAALDAPIYCVSCDPGVVSCVMLTCRPLNPPAQPRPTLDQIVANRGPPGASYIYLRELGILESCHAWTDADSADLLTARPGLCRNQHHLDQKMLDWIVAMASPSYIHW
jgi:hypothetical protein